MKKLIPILTVLFIFFFTSCDKEYTVEIQRYELFNGTKIRDDYDSKTFKAKDEVAAQKEAYSKYLSQIKVFAQMEKQGSEYLWCPVEYEINDSDGHIVDQGLFSLDENGFSPEDYYFQPEDENLYIEYLGHFKYSHTPYGKRHPKPIRL